MQTEIGRRRSQRNQWLLRDRLQAGRSREARGSQHNSGVRRGVRAKRIDVARPTRVAPKGMARLLIGAIHAYRCLATRFPRRSRCLFAVSCSTHVERETALHGFFAGVAAMRLRVAACRPGYSFVVDASDWAIECCDGTIITPEQLAPVIHDEYETLTAALPPPLDLQLQTV
jgi:putative component of membrane protein insertase Oxa1/YidC/SpoIIIJ protein YidD